MDASTGISQLKKGGFRIGRGRNAILSVFEKASKPLAALEILSLLSKEHILLNKTTVYRELEFLKEQKLIREVPVSTMAVYYESAMQDHHHHLVCENCNTIVEVQTHELEENIDKLTQFVAKNNHFAIQNHSLEFFGTCANCS